VATGIGIAPVLAVLFEDPALREMVTPVLPDHPLQQATLYVVYPSRKFLPPKLRTFVDFIVEFLSVASERKPRFYQAPRPAHGPAVTSLQREQRALRIDAVGNERGCNACPARWAPGSNYAGLDRT
jgi:hypothetical protein